jgi:hypothetical protein
MIGYEQEVRIAHYETMFRAANESLRGVFAAHADDGPLEGYPFLCECGDHTCTGAVPIPLEVYEQIREHPTRFLILPGHKRLGSERIVDEADGYEVVEKMGAAGEIARDHWSQFASNRS